MSLKLRCCVVVATAVIMQASIIVVLSCFDDARICGISPIPNGVTQLHQGSATPFNHCPSLSSPVQSMTQANHVRSTDQALAKQTEMVKRRGAEGVIPRSQELSPGVARAGKIKRRFPHLPFPSKDAPTGRSRALSSSCASHARSARRARFEGRGRRVWSGRSNFFRLSYLQYFLVYFIHSVSFFSDKC